MKQVNPLEISDLSQEMLPVLDYVQAGKLD